MNVSSLASKLTVEEVAKMFRRRGRRLLAKNDMAGLRELYAEWGATAQIWNRDEMPQARQEMEQTLIEMLSQPESNFQIDRFANL